MSLFSPVVSPVVALSNVTVSEFGITGLPFNVTNVAELLICVLRSSPYTVVASGPFTPLLVVVRCGNCRQLPSTIGVATSSSSSSTSLSSASETVTVPLTELLPLLTTGNSVTSTLGRSRIILVVVATSVCLKLLVLWGDGNRSNYKKVLSNVNLFFGALLTPSKH